MKRELDFHFYFDKWYMVKLKSAWVLNNKVNIMSGRRNSSLLLLSRDILNALFTMQSHTKYVLKVLLLLLLFLLLLLQDWLAQQPPTSCMTLYEAVCICLILTYFCPNEVVTNYSIQEFPAVFFFNSIINFNFSSKLL